MTRHSRSIAGLFLALLLLAGCGGSAADDHTVTLSDAAPAKVDLVLQLTRGNYSATFQAVALVFISRKAPMDTHVRLTRNETMTCGTVKLNRSGTEFTGDIADAKPGQSVTCTYSSHGAQAVISYTIPPDLIVLTPPDGAKVRRSRDFAVTYQPAGAQYGAVSVVADVRPDDWFPLDHGYQYGTPQPETGTYQFDIAHAPTGSVALELFREFDVSPAGSPFHSLTIAYVQDGGAGFTFT
ncbi:MAG TPA: hypothetical protein VGR57_07450 [Ktedonobacterales bacterium]|nr:hypothetical protein [Ktedonobacterales bacterium]